MTGVDMARQAINGGYIGIPYSRLDCQAFIERVLGDMGVRDPTSGKRYNWRGSNHMWREAVHDPRELAGNYGTVPVGAWLFTIKHDGGERDRGYRDDKGNAAHVGLYLGDGQVMHSTTGGVQFDKISSKRWTHAALANCLDYDTRITGGCSCGCSCCGKED